MNSRGAFTVIPAGQVYPRKGENIVVPEALFRSGYSKALLELAGQSVRKTGFAGSRGAGVRRSIQMGSGRGGGGYSVSCMIVAV